MAKKSGKSPGGHGFPSKEVAEAAASRALGSIPDDMYGASEVEKVHEDPANIRMGFLKKPKGSMDKVKRVK